MDRAYFSRPIGSLPTLNGTIAHVSGGSLWGYGPRVVRVLLESRVVAAIEGPATCERQAEPDGVVRRLRSR